MKLHTILASTLLLSLIGCFCPKEPHKLPEGITAQKVRQIKLGMTEKEVVNLLGDPLYTKPAGTITRSYQGKITTRKRGISYYYTEQRHQDYYPKLWVNLDTNHSNQVIVGSVYAKAFDCFGEQAIYVLRHDVKMDTLIYWEGNSFEEYFK